MRGTEMTFRPACCWHVLLTDSLTSFYHQKAEESRVRWIYYLKCVLTCLNFDMRGPEAADLMVCDNKEPGGNLNLSPPPHLNSIHKARLQKKRRMEGKCFDKRLHHFICHFEWSFECIALMPISSLALFVPADCLFFTKFPIWIHLFLSINATRTLDCKKKFVIVTVNLSIKLWNDSQHKKEEKRQCTIFKSFSPPLLFFVFDYFQISSAEQYATSKKETLSDHNT